MAPDFLDLFCGAGGSGLGLRRAGLGCVAGLDTDPLAVEVYAREVGPACRADVREVDPRRFAGEGLFLLWASPPCPPWSEGRRAHGLPSGYDVPEGRLLLEPIRWAEALRPVWVVVENVGGIPEDAVRDVQASLAGLGYQVSILRLSARAWVPQNRDHVFIIGGPARVPCPPVPPVSVRFGEIMDGRGAKPVEPAVFRLLARRAAREGGWSIPIVEADGVLPTVTTRAFSDRWTAIVYDGDGRYRFPTFREAMRAQGFPDEHTLYALHERSRSAAWRLLGNAVPVPMAEAVGRAILSADGKGTDPGAGP